MWTVAAASWLAGCAPTEHFDFSPRPGEPPAPPDPTGSTGSTGDTGPVSTAETGGPAIDCSIRPEATMVRYHQYVDSSEDFTFDDQGYLWGVATGSGGLIRTALDGNAEMMRPDLSSWGRGVRILPDDPDFVIAEPDTGSLVRIEDQTMATTLIHGGYNQPNGIALNELGMVHMTQAVGGVWRIDPATGDQTLLFDSPVSTDGITFDPTYRRLYWNSEYGEVATLLFDDDGNVIEEPNILAEVDLTGGGGGLTILDGMAADACGNLYVVVMSGRIMRILPDGTQELFADLSNHDAGTFICAANFGSGVGGWERDHLYVMSLTSGLFELDVGIVGRPEPHL